MPKRRPHRRPTPPARPAAASPLQVQPAHGPVTPRFLAQLRESAAVAVREAAVSNKAWSDFTAAEYDIDQWKRASLVDTGDGDADAKDRYKLLVREPSGALNRNGVQRDSRVRRMR